MVILYLLEGQARDDETNRERVAKADKPANTQAVTEWREPAALVVGDTPDGPPHKWGRARGNQRPAKGVLVGKGGDHAMGSPRTGPRSPPPSPDGRKSDVTLPPYGTVGKNAAMRRAVAETR
jgi:hypothetical protein